jgi:hypothetical protein
MDQQIEHDHNHVLEHIFNTLRLLDDKYDSLLEAIQGQRGLGGGQALKNSIVVEEDSKRQVGSNPKYPISMEEEEA